ncbi:MAG TPA: tetratricopeptide repeat protein [Gemmatimonadales bacterium]|nr:tetratricopeptide repeat protein [Gemmatimonadales bacterium]
MNLKAAAENRNVRDRMLRQTQDVLTRAITGDGQDKNPGAWYYFGRYYVEMGDAAGADSAFRRAEALAPQCKQDIDSYRNRLWSDVVAAGLRNWQENKPDSAKLLLRQAGALRPGHPRPFFGLGQLYAAQDQPDSAAYYLTRGAAAAGDDTAFAANKKDALGTVARLYLRRVQTDPAAQRWQRARFSRDSIQRLLSADSSTLALREIQSASRRARGARLAPADQRDFARDSTTRAQGVAERRAALAAQAQQNATDSAAAQATFEPAIQAFRTYLTTYPDATDAVTGLASLYYQSGRLTEAEAAFDAIYPPGRPGDADVAVEAGRGALRARLFGAGTKLLARALERRPYDRDGLLDLATGYQALRDSARLLPAAQRLAGVDPLNRTTLRLLAAGWDLRGRRDSAQRYKDLADGGLQLEVVVSTFLSDSAGFTLSGVAANGGSTPSPVQRLTFEFLDAQGAVRATQAVEIPVLPAQGTRPIEIHVPGSGLVAWRYRPS